MSINIRNLQHYMYCPRRYALLEINRDWVENAFVVKANIMHEHVHDSSYRYSKASKTVLSSVMIYNDDLDLFGKTDCIEFVKDENGVYIERLDGRYRVRIVEHKPTQPKETEFSETDAIQVFAQKLCADYVWKCDSEAYIFYSNTRKRVKLPFDDRFDYYYSILTEIIDGINRINETKSIPLRRPNQKCSGCSLRDVCIPKRGAYSVRKIVESG